jgi:hypothetical protein
MSIDGARVKTLSVSAIVWASMAYGAPAFAAPVSSISQYGITWTFDKEYDAGQFVTGDFWVAAAANTMSPTTSLFRARCWLISPWSRASARRKAWT